jgi:arginine-tRNA-protein transferase
MSRSPLRLPLYLSAPHPCSYLPGRSANTLFADPDAPMTMADYGELLHYGFRRSGNLVYAPRCEGCKQCTSVRVPVRGFRPRRNHRRVLNANHDVTWRSRPAAFDPAHYALYRRYTAQRHPDGEMARASPADYLGFLRADWSDTELLEFQLGDQVVAVAATDRVEDGLSAVYTFFSPELSARSLGTLAILTQIEAARDAGLPYLYLGYWIRDCRKMAYKANFRPLELCIQGRWRTFGSNEALP